MAQSLRGGGILTGVQGEPRRRIDLMIADAIGKTPDTVRYHGNRMILELALGRHLTPDEARRLERQLRNKKPLEVR